MDALYLSPNCRAPKHHEKLPERTEKDALSYKLENEDKMWLTHSTDCMWMVFVAKYCQLSIIV